MFWKRNLHGIRTESARFCILAQQGQLTQPWHLKTKFEFWFWPLTYDCRCREGKISRDSFRLFFSNFAASLVALTVLPALCFTNKARKAPPFCSRASGLQRRSLGVAGTNQTAASLHFQHTTVSKMIPKICGLFTERVSLQVYFMINTSIPPR